MFTKIHNETFRGQVYGLTTSPGTASVLTVPVASAIRPLVSGDSLIVDVKWVGVDTVTGQPGSNTSSVYLTLPSTIAVVEFRHAASSGVGGSDAYAVIDGNGDLTIEIINGNSAGNAVDFHIQAEATYLYRS